MIKEIIENHHKLPHRHDFGEHPCEYLPKTGMDRAGEVLTGAGNVAGKIKINTYFCGRLPKIGIFLSQILRNITDITQYFSITEYFFWKSTVRNASPVWS
jgi:hypothetical protein